VREILSEAFAQAHVGGKRVLAIIPDGTRSAPIDVMFRQVTSILTPQVRELDFLIALGTHPPMNEDAINQRLGLAPGEMAATTRTCGYSTITGMIQPAQADRTISEEEIDTISGGLMREKVNVTINKLVFIMTCS